MKITPHCLLGLVMVLGFRAASQSADHAILKPSTLAGYVERFNAMEDETVVNAIG